MKEQTIECPKCGVTIPVTTALVATIEQQIKQEAESEFAAREKELDAKAKKTEKRLLAQEKEIEKRREELERGQEDLKERVSREVAARLKEERERVAEDAHRKAREDVEAEMQHLKEDLAKKSKKVDEAMKLELEFRRKMQEIEEAKQEFKLTVQRKVDEGKAEVEKKTEDRLTEEFRLKVSEKDQKIKEMTSKIEELKQKAEQGSQQLQGDTLEDDIEEILRAAFVRDTIEPVPRGKRGADVLQRVNAGIGQSCGSLLWECKWTKGWSNDWIPKLRDDQREAGADLAVLVTTAFPKDASDFDVRDGVVLIRPAFAVPLAGILRERLKEVHMARRSMEGKSEKKEMIYNFLTGPVFRQAVKAIAEALRSVQNSIVHERQAMNKIWKRRETEVLRAVHGLIDLYAPIQGVLGASLPQVEELELDATAPLELPAPGAPSPSPDPRKAKMENGTFNGKDGEGI